MIGVENKSETRANAILSWPLTSA